MSKHTPTPGPRRIGFPPPNGEQTIGTEDGMMVAVATTGGTIGKSETLANARLIAAAPDQHEANKTSLCVLCALLDAHEWHPNMRKDIEFAIESNRHAIAKATGATC